MTQTDTGIKAVPANPAMIKAYKEGIPENGKPFLDDVMIVKIDGNKTPNPVSPYAVDVPGTLSSVPFIEKDSKRYRETSGWGCAQFLHDAPSGAF